MQNSYITTQTNDKGTLFFVGDGVQKALSYANKWGYESGFEWLKEKFLTTKVEMLELITTVDWAMVDLKKRNETISMETVKKYIYQKDKWRAKLDKWYFTDEYIIHAIQWSYDLFGGNDETNN